MRKKYLRTTLTIAIPMTITQIMTSFSGFLGNIMLSHLGHDVLAASALLASTQMMVTLIFLSILLSMGPMIGQANGRGETYEVGNLMQQGWILSLILSVGALLIYWFIYPILLFFGQDPHLASLVVPYFHWAMLGMPILLLNVSCSQLCYVTGKQVMMTFIMAVQTLTLITCAYIFIFGKFGIPAMGIAGFGIAFDIATITQFLLVMSAFVRFHEFQHYHLFKSHLRNGWQHLKKLFSVGWPITIQMTAELTAFGFITYMVGWLGAIPLAASQITSQFILLLVIPTFGFSASAGILVGRAMGAKNYADVKAAGYMNLLLSLSVSIVGGCLMILFSEHLAHLFIKPAQENYAATLALVKPLFIIGVMTLFFDTLRNTLTGALRGLFDTRISMVIALLSLWIIRMPLAYLFGFVWHGGIMGIAWSGFIAMLFGGGLTLWRWHWKTRNMWASPL